MEITNYDRFNELETPALVLNSDGSVAYRNKVAEVLARYIRRVSDMAEVFPDAPDALKNCIFQGQTAIVTVQLGRECRSPALLIPDGCRNTQRAILFCSPFFKEESAAEPDRGPEKNIHTNSRVKRPEGGEYRSLSSLFLRPFILAVSRSLPEMPERIFGWRMSVFFSTGLPKGFFPPGAFRSAPGVPLTV